MYRYIKSGIDLVSATLLLIILLPFLGIIYVLQLIFVSKPLFIQRRPGRNGKIFEIIKFRTLKVVDDESTVTIFGKLIRTLSIDELPQLINILKGEMSFIGPRPLLEEYLPLYNKEQSTRHKVKPGITGLAQVKGRNKLSWKDSLKMDADYANNYSFGLDLKILFLTFAQLLKFSEVSAGKQYTREPFNGQN